MYIYLPSCNFTVARPEASKKIKQYLSSKFDVKVVGCCRPQQKQMTPEDTILSICLTCSAITNEVNPDTPEKSLWEYLLTDNNFPWPDFHGEEMTIQDCWRARNKPTMLDAVRACMVKMNLRPVEIAENREKTQFDGVWRYNPVLQKNLDIAPKYFQDIAQTGLELIPPDEQKARMEAWVSQYTTERVATYCTACLKGTLLGGANAVHLLELLTINM